MVALGDADPLEWHRFHLASGAATYAHHMFLVLQWGRKTTFQSFPVRNGVGVLQLSLVAMGDSDPLESHKPFSFPYSSLTLSKHFGKLR